MQQTRRLRQAPPPPPPPPPPHLPSVTSCFVFAPVAYVDASAVVAGLVSDEALASPAEVLRFRPILAASVVAGTDLTLLKLSRS
ncbi:hypothetical protein C0Q70_15571 [Pomacea canaliculata]|uniref:Uncharacterized protein n=1 Tax=Pomacea canaliculata TaxID=400727 RepID=A0A2T7NV81_POMCA|nr:hypothetical protein C0Q70_15571 [Pomacea canaliculata]